MRSHSQEAKTIPSQGIDPGSSPGGTIWPPRAVYGDLAEWLIATVLKTVNRETGSRVRIPESPFWSHGREVDAAFLLRKHPGNRIEGSNPSAIVFFADMAKLEDASDLSPDGNPCRFESDCPHETKKRRRKIVSFFRFPLIGGDSPAFLSPRLWQRLAAFLISRLTVGTYRLFVV